MRLIRKLAVILMAALLVFSLAACGPEEQDDPVPFDRESAIKPDPSADGKTIGSYSLTHVDTDRYGADAGILLDYAYQALDDASITPGSNVLGIYGVSCGLAANKFSFDPFLIENDAPNLKDDKLFMVVLHDFEGYNVLCGWYRESDLDGKDIRDGAEKVFSHARDEALAAFGLAGSSYTINFNPVKLYGLTAKNVDPAFNAKYFEMQSEFDKVSFAFWYGDERGDFPDGKRVKVPNEAVTSWDSLKTYMELRCTKDLASDIVDNIDEMMYVAYEGALWYIEVGPPAMWDVQEINTFRFAEKGDDRAYIVIEVKRAVDFDSPDYNLEYWLCSLQKVDGVWKFSSYDDIVHATFTGYC